MFAIDKKQRVVSRRPDGERFRGLISTDAFDAERTADVRPRAAR